MSTDLITSIQYSAPLGTILLAYYLVPYALDPYNLRRRFSGPWLAAFTNRWLENAVNTGSQSEIIQELHHKYGTFVRIGPNHISIADPDAHQAVYGHASGLLKSDFYAAFGSDGTDIFSTRDRDAHSKKRKRIAHIFSQRIVLEFEPRVRSQILNMCIQWDKRCTEAAHGISGFNWVAKDGKAAIDCCSQFAYLAFDIIGDLALGAPFGMIQAQKDAAPMSHSLSATEDLEVKTSEVPIVSVITHSAHLMTSVGVYPRWAQKILRLAPWNLAGVAAVRDFVGLTIAAVNSRLRRGPTVSEDGKMSVDLIDKLLEVKNEDGSTLSRDELMAEAFTLIFAGGDTTSNSLGAICYYLAKHPAVQQRLQAELDEHVPLATTKDEVEGDPFYPSPDIVVQYEQVKDLPYLNSCIKEGQRLHSAVGQGLPRVVPPGKTFTFGGHTFKAGSVLGVPSFTTNRSSTLWGLDAEGFRPERWLEGGSSLMSKYFVPFSLGPRGCVGRNLATMNLLLIVATVFRRYEVRLASATSELHIRDVFSRETSGYDVTIKLRSVA